MTGWTTALVLALQAASARLEEPQDPDRPVLAAADLEALRSKNVFSPPRPPRRVESSSSRRDERRSESPAAAAAAAARPRPPVVTGIYLDTSAGVHAAVLEDRNEERLRLFREPRTVRPGDAIGDFAVEAVEPDRLVLKRGEETVTLKAGDALPDGAAPAPAAASAPPAPAPDGASAQEVLERLRQRRRKNRSSEEEEPR